MPCNSSRISLSEPAESSLWLVKLRRDQDAGGLNLKQNDNFREGAVDGDDLIIKFALFSLTRTLLLLGRRPQRHSGLGKAPHHWIQKISASKR